MIRAAIFDVDGTLIDSVDLHAEAWQWAFAHFGHDIPYEQVRQQIGKGGDQLMPVFLSDRELRDIGEKMEKWRGELYEREYIHRVRPFPRVRELFLRLRNDGKQIALASSAKKDEVNFYNEVANVADLLDTRTSADDAEKSKPHPDIFHAALARLEGVRAEEAIVIGDTPYDAQAAAKAGIATIGLLCGGFPEHDLREAGCIEIYPAPADLLDHYEESVLSEKKAA
jgi:HAD superfamily hydrolase (TIGR01509 family)